VFLVVGLGEDVVTMIFNPESLIVPIGALIPRLDVDMSPYLSRGCDQDVWSYTRYGSFDDI